MRVPVPLPHLRGCRLERVLAEDDAVHLELRPAARTARCPRCRRRSRRVHSTYTRRVADLPVAGRPVLLHLRVRRFRCPARRCPRRTFAEQVPHVVARYGRRTHALRRALEQVGLSVGGRPGVRLGGRLGLTATRDILLRAVRALPEPAPPAARVLGVDEFAVRRGRTYGTVLVDVERRRPLDLLEGRSAAQFATWLQDRPAPAVICRDRAECFAEGARQGAPHAVQVADRYHLLANLGDAVERVTAQSARRWADDPLEVPAAPPPEGAAARVGHGRRSMSSPLRVAKKRSATALSNESPTEPVEARSPASRSRRPKAAEAYCPPWSLWCTSPGAGRRARRAISKAARTSSVRRWSAMAHPTTRRLPASSTTARYSQPSSVAM